MTYQDNFKKWVDFADLPDYLRQDLTIWTKKTKEDAFYTNLEFGTAGMRGLIGAGTNRINIYVVRQATEGLARLIESKGGNEKSAVWQLPTIVVTSHLSLPLNLRQFLQNMVSNLTYLKAFVQLQNFHLQFVTSTVLQVS